MTITVDRWDDPTSWNLFVAATPRAHFQQSWEWGELAPYLGGTAIRLAALRSGQLVGAMQVFVNPLRGIGRTHLYVPRGPAIATPEFSVLGPLLDDARRVGRQRRAIGIKLEPNVPCCEENWKQSLQSFGFNPSHPPSQPRSSWVLDITPDADSLLGGMKQKTRYNIRLAARKGVEVLEGGMNDLDVFYKLYRETAVRDGFFVHERSFYAEMFSLFGGGGNFALLLARYQGEVIAAVTLLHFGGTCWYLHGASGNDNRNLMAPHLLQWEAIRWAKNRDCTLYDFRAIPDILREDQDMYGVYRFKEGFGGRQFTTLHTYAAPYSQGLFGLWQLYFSGRFALDAWQRRRGGLPARQFA